MAKGKSSPVSKAVHFEDLPEEFRQCIDDYIVNGNKSKAFELTQPDNDNKTSMRVNAQIFFKKENIQNIVAERKQQLASVGSMGTIEIIRQIEKIAQGVQEDQFSDKTSVKDQLAALNMLCKLNGLTDDRPQINNTIQQIFVDDISQ